MVYERIPGSVSWSLSSVMGVARRSSRTQTFRTVGGRKQVSFIGMEMKGIPRDVGVQSATERGSRLEDRFGR